MAERIIDVPLKLSLASFDALTATLLYQNGMTRALQEFLTPYFTACNSFWEQEKVKLNTGDPDRMVRDYSSLYRFNAQIGRGAWAASHAQMLDYHSREIVRMTEAFLNVFTSDGKETIDQYMAEKVEVLRRLAVDYEDAIRDVGEQFGFHFDRDPYTLVAQTDRMLCYQVLPTRPDVQTRPELKPILIVHPYVLGSGILAFLPGENKSYVHAFANMGIPTYVRIIKDIHVAEPVQVMTGEDDARDTAYFCRIIKQLHDKPVTLNGFCQGGFISMCDLLSGALDGLVDALITCVAPLDGTKSRGLVEYLEHIAPRFRNLAYATKTLPSGNEVVDGKVMSWVYKLKSIEREAPIFTYYRDIKLFETMLAKGIQGIGRTAAAINHWLLYDRTDLPIDITQMSFDSYTIPITTDGNLPIKMFGRQLNLDYIKEKQVKFLICYAAKDDLVDPPAALAPKQFIDVELTEFPKGHAAIATSWSDPDSEYGLHKIYPNGSRGPVRFQLDLSSETERKARS